MRLLKSDDSFVSLIEAEEPQSGRIDGRLEEDAITSFRYTPTALTDHRLKSLIIGSALGVVGSSP